MAVISADAPHHTVIVVFTVVPAEQDALVERLRAVAAEHVDHQGFIANAIHRSTDGTRVTEYVQWRTQQDWAAFMETGRGRAHVQDPGFVVDAHVYELAGLFEG